jgi:hypothetical protein
MLGAFRFILVDFCSYTNGWVMSCQSILKILYRPLLCPQVVGRYADGAICGRYNIYLKVAKTEILEIFFWNSDFKNQIFWTIFFGNSFVRLDVKRTHINQKMEIFENPTSAFQTIVIWAIKKFLSDFVGSIYPTSKSIH